jgi:hypothetical protein
MAAEQRGAGANAPKIKHDEVTAKVVSDPKAPADSVLVTGFLGASSEPEHTRIYWDASMGSYVDVATADIIHTEPLPKEQSSLGGSYIWLKRAASALAGGQGGNPMTGRFFEGPLMAAYGTQFGGMTAPGAAGFGGAANVAYSYYIACHPTLVCTQLCHSVQYPCVSGYCTRTVIECTGLCPVITPNCPYASPGCPAPGPGTPVQGAGAGAAMADPAMAAVMPSLACSYARGCWYSWGACPTLFGCGPFHTPNCPQFQEQPAGAEAAAAAAQPMMMPSLVCSYAPGCWYSWGACPSQGACGGPHHPTPWLPQAAAFAAAPQWSGYYCPGTAACSIASCGHPCVR